MSGEEIKKIIKAEGFTISEIATLLGFDNDQRLHSALKSSDVKSGLIEDIARVTNRNVCVFFSDSSTTKNRNGDNNSGFQINSGGGDVKAENISTPPPATDRNFKKIIDENAELRKIIATSQEQISMLISQIAKK